MKIKKDLTSFLQNILNNNAKNDHNYLDNKEQSNQNGLEPNENHDKQEDHENHDKQEDHENHDKQEAQDSKYQQNYQYENNESNIIQKNNNYYHKSKEYTNSRHENNEDEYDSDYECDANDNDDDSYNRIQCQSKYDDYEQQNGDDEDNEENYEYNSEEENYEDNEEDEDDDEEEDDDDEDDHTIADDKKNYYMQNNSNSTYSLSRSNNPKDINFNKNKNNNMSNISKKTFNKEINSNFDNQKNNSLKKPYLYNPNQNYIEQKTNQNPYAKQKTLGGFVLKTYSPNPEETILINKPINEFYKNNYSTRLLDKITHLHVNNRDELDYQGFQLIGESSNDPDINLILTKTEKKIRSTNLFISTNYTGTLDSQMRNYLSNLLDKQLKYNLEEKIFQGILETNNKPPMYGILQSLYNKEKEIIDNLDIKIEKAAKLDVKIKDQTIKKLEKEKAICKTNGKCIIKIKKSQLSIIKLASIAKNNEINSGNIMMNSEILDYLINQEASSEQIKTSVIEKNAIGKLDIIIQNLISDQEINNINDFKDKYSSYILIGDLKICTLLLFGEMQNAEFQNSQGSTILGHSLNLNLELNITPDYKENPKLIAILIEDDLTK